MDSEERRLTVSVAPRAIDDLDGIWRWNASRYNIAHADAYLRYLKMAIDELATRHAKGRPVPARPELRYVLVRRRSKGHGHIAVYTVDPGSITIVHVFHTARDWQAKIAQEKG